MVTLAAVKEAVMEQLVSANIDVNLVGQFDESTIGDYLLQYLGTIPYKERPDAEIKAANYHMAFVDVPRSVEVVVEDDEERAIMCFGSKTLTRYFGGILEVTGRWTKVENPPNEKMANPLYCSRTLHILTKVK